MQFFYGLDSVPAPLCGGAVSIGKFDGIHPGHSLILQRLKNHADRLRVPSVVITFDPPPITLLRPDLNIRPICTLQRKTELIRNFSVDAFFVLKTDTAFLNQDAETFFLEFLKEKLHAEIIVEGSNFSFGRNRGGNAEFLRRFGEQTGIKTDIVEPVYSDGIAVSSSAIRLLLQEGKIEQANRLMPQPYQLTGTVIAGHQRGRTLGFPTANLNGTETVIPLNGVYASVVKVEGCKYIATTHIGSNITFGQTEPTVESYLHDFDEDLYGKQLDVVLLARVRDSKRFDRIDELTAQMQRDVNQCTKIVSSGGVPPTPTACFIL